MITLAISHNIFLTRQQRYDLYNKQVIETIGVSVPVWFANGTTSEPANEVFCKYKLINNTEQTGIEFVKRGYDICLPQIETNYKLIEPTTDEWLKMTDIEKEKWFQETQKPLNCKNLLDLCDGGSEYLYYRTHQKKIIKNMETHVVHFIEIKTIESLLNSLSN